MAHRTGRGTQSPLSADALLNPPRESKRDDAAQLLETMLADGPMPARDVYARGEAEGISEITLKRAKKSLGVESHRRGKDGEIGGGSWWWSLDGFKGVTDLGDHPLPSQMSPLISAGQSDHSIKGINSDVVKGAVQFGAFALCSVCTERHCYGYVDDKPVCPKCLAGAG